MKYLIKTTQPTAEPVSLAEARLHLRLDTSGSPASHPDDTLVQTLITAARENAEQYTGVTIASCSYEAQGAAVDSKLSLQTYPVTSVYSVTYQDSDGVTQTVAAADYYVDNFARPSKLVFKQNTPSQDITVQFTAGYTDLSSPNPYPCPAGVKAAILLMVGNLYENRESIADNATQLKPYERPQSYLYLLTPHRINMGV